VRRQANQDTDFFGAKCTSWGTPRGGCLDFPSFLEKVCAWDLACKPQRRKKLRQRSRKKPASAEFEPTDSTPHVQPENSKKRSKPKTSLDSSTSISLRRYSSSRATWGYRPLRALNRSQPLRFVALSGITYHRPCGVEVPTTNNDRPDFSPRIHFA
jgi:hypothetical protein